jgi:hypothetical protein
MVINIKHNIMKKLSLLLLSIIVFSCGEHEDVIYDPNTSTTFAFFSTTSTAMEVYLGDAPSSEQITVGVSTLSSQDRTVTLSVDEDLSTAAVGSYDVDLEVTIPANEYFGTSNVTAITDELTLCTTASVLLKIDSVSDGGVVSAAAHSVEMTKNENPLPDDFAIGEYTLTFNGVQLLAGSSVWGDGTVVNITAGSSNSERTFIVKPYPDYNFTNPELDYTIELVCGKTTLKNGPTGLTCTQGGPGISIASVSTFGTFDGEDDSSFTLVFSEDVGGASCGVEETNSYTFTKN